MRNYISFYIALICFLVFCTINFTLNAQNLDSSVQQDIDNYKSDIEKYKADGNKTQQANSLNKIAYLYWENGIYNDAVNYFSQSLELNKSIGNKNAIKSIH